MKTLRLRTPEGVIHIRKDVIVAVSECIPIKGKNDTVVLSKVYVGDDGNAFNILEPAKDVLKKWRSK